MKKIVALIIASCILEGLKAQDTAVIRFSFNHLALSVKDVERSAAFYKNVLQLKEISNRTKIEGIRWFTFEGDKELHLISIVKEDVKINKAVHFALATARFDEFIKRLSALKIVYSDWPGKQNTVNIRADGVKQVFFQDPDGYWIEVNSVN